MNDDGVGSYAGQINFERDICIGIFDRHENLVALVQGFIYEESGSRLMEAAFSTDEAMRRRGLGTLLFAEITDYALVAGVDRVIALCLAENRPMRALMRAIGATCQIEDGEVIGQLQTSMRCQDGPIESPPTRTQYPRIDDSGQEYSHSHDGRIRAQATYE